MHFVRSSLTGEREEEPRLWRQHACGGQARQMQTTATVRTVRSFAIPSFEYTALHYHSDNIHSIQAQVEIIPVPILYEGS